MKVEVIGGSRYTPKVSAARFSLNNSELHILCKTESGPITIDLPKIADFGIATNAKIFIEDVDGMAATNNITIIAPSRVVPLVAAVLGVRRAGERVGLVIIGNKVEKLADSIGSSFVLSGYAGLVNNNGAHIIDAVESYTDRIEGVFTILYSSSLSLEKSEEGAPIVSVNAIEFVSKLDSKTSYILSKNGAKVEIFASSSKEFGILRDTLLDDLTTITSASFVKQLKVSLTATQIKTLFSQPVDLIQAPGVGKLIEVISVSSKLNFNTVGFDVVGNVLSLTTDTATRPQFNDAGALNTSTLTTVHKLQQSTKMAQNDAQLVENKKLVAKFDSADSVNGDGTIDLYITYQVITL